MTDRPGSPRSSSAVRAEQNLRAIKAGGHVVIEQILDAPIPVFKDYRWLKQTATSSTTPRPRKTSPHRKTERAISRAEEIVDAAAQIIAEKTLTTF